MSEFATLSVKGEGCGEVAEWLKAIDCKSVTEMFRKFKSYPLQFYIETSNNGLKRKNYLIIAYIISSFYKNMSNIWTCLFNHEICFIYY